MLLLALGLFAAGPAGGAPGTRAALERGRPVRFLVGGWCIARAFERPEWLVAVDAAGFDYVQNLDQGFAPRYGSVLLQHLDSLRAARPGFRLQAIVTLSRGDATHAAFTGRTDVSPESLATVARTLRPGGDFNRPSTLGYCLWDEPCTRAEIDRLGAVARFLRAQPATAGQLAFSNLHPIADGRSPGCYEREFRGSRDLQAGYSAYLDAYLGQFDALPEPAPVLSFDHYPYIGRGHAREDYSANLAIANERARAHGRFGARIPLWVVVQLGRFRGAGEPYASTPTFAQTQLQVWQALAHGAKGISYWTIFPTGAPKGPRFDFTAWDESGRSGPQVDALTALNRELHALGPTLMELDAVGCFRGTRAGGLVPDPVTTVGSGPSPVRRVAAQAGAADLLVGVLAGPGDGDTWLLVVNTDLARSRTFRLELAAPADTIERIDRRDGQRVRVAAGTSRLDVAALPPAGGALYRLHARAGGSGPP